MIAAIIGYPGSGKGELADQLAQTLPQFRVVGFSEIRDLLESSASEAAVVARQLARAGHAVPDSLFGQLLAEAANNRDVLFAGYPRNLAQLRNLQSFANEAVHIIHMRASAELIDDHRRARGLRPIEQEHPGALARIDADLDPMIAVASRLLPLDAASDMQNLLASALRFLAVL
jgi:adenylate kinase family enzyme